MSKNSQTTKLTVRPKTFSVAKACSILPDIKTIMALTVIKKGNIYKHGHINQKPSTRAHLNALSKGFEKSLQLSRKKKGRKKKENMCKLSCSSLRNLGVKSHF